jgi:large subunit ribosomal protein L24
MKQEFNKNWKASKQPRKQRKYVYNAPQHIKNKMMSSTLDKSLKEKYNRNSISIRKGDEVKIMRGSYKNKTGKVTMKNIMKNKIAIENIQKTKKDGSKVNVWIHPSNVKIISLSLEDKKRLLKLNKKLGEKNAPEKK